MKTPTEVQADMIRELEAKVSLLLDDLFYARAEIAKMPSDIYLCPPTSENDYEGLKWCDAYEELERENAALREQVEHLIGMIEQLEGDLAHFATIEAFEAKKEAQP
jgi:hypothetical protein